MPAMGSHGGGTPRGQLQVLGGYGITPKAVNAPIDAAMEVDEIGRDADGYPIFFSRAAREADGIIAINRVKVHTDYQSDLESGVTKMLVIGLGKRAGAESIHKRGLRGLSEGIPAAARVIMAQVPFRLGVATVENAYEELAVVKAILPRDLLREEKELLQYCRTLLLQLPFDHADVLIVEEIGKEICGTGMDTNVIGRLMITGEKDFERPFIRRIAVLDLTNASHGNCTGLGLADFITERVYQKIDLKAFYVNTLTGAMVERGKIPMIMASDEEAIKAAAQTAWDVDPAKVKMAKIRNTLEIYELQVSETLLGDILSDKEKAQEIEVVGPWEDFHFTAQGELLSPTPLLPKEEKL